MASVARAVQRIKEDLAAFLPETKLLQACHEHQLHWRERQLPPVLTIQLFVLQVLNLNAAIQHLRRLAKLQVSAAAYCKARMRLPLELLQQLLRESAQAMLCQSARGLWGLRVFLVDGTSTITPDTPALLKTFGYPQYHRKDCSFPVPKILGLLDAASGVILEALCLPLLTHEQSQVWQVHGLLRAGDLLMGDRGFCSYCHLAMLQMRGIFGLFRMHQKQIVDFHPHRKERVKGQRGKPRSKFLRRLAKHDQIVQWPKPAKRPEWMGIQQWAQLPQAILVREVRYAIVSKGCRTRVITIATTLLDEQLYPKQEIARLYALRWQVEGHFAELKTTLQMQSVKCKTPEGVQKELAVYCLLYNLVHMLMLRAAKAQGVECRRISFVDALRYLMHAEPGEGLPILVINPERPDRHEPRAVKTSYPTYRRMNKPRKYFRKHPELCER